jgi:hypothetical protein
MRVMWRFQGPAQDSLAFERGGALAGAATGVGFCVSLLGSG